MRNLCGSDCNLNAAVSMLCALEDLLTLAGAGCRGLRCRGGCELMISGRNRCSLFKTADGAGAFHQALGGVCCRCFNRPSAPGVTERSFAFVVTLVGAVATGAINIRIAA